MAIGFTQRCWWIAGLLALAFLLAACGSASRPPSPAAHSASAPGVATIVAPPPTSEPATAIPSPATQSAATVAIAGLRFSPEVLHVKAGESVTWTFADGSVPHTVTAFDGSFDSGILTQGTFTVRFDTPGSYCYQCAVHPGRNLCAQASQPARNGRLLLFGGTDALRGRASQPAVFGGGHMQGEIIVEP